MRNLDITYTKAMGIMLMVLCHSAIGNGQVVDFVYMFHMPLFFFFSGYCLKAEYFDKPQVFVWKRVKGVYWPYLKWSVVFLLLHNVFFALNLYNGEIGYKGEGSQTYDVADITEKLQDIVLHMQGHEQLLGGYWFMRALLYGSLIAFGVLWLINFANTHIKAKPVYKLLAGGGILLTLCIWLNHAHHTLTVLYITPQDLTAAIFFIIGHTFRCIDLRKFRSYEMLAATLIVLIGSFFWPMALNNSFYDNHRLLPYIMTAVLGTWAVYS